MKIAEDLSMAKSKKNIPMRFVRAQIVADEKISDDQILQNWKAIDGNTRLTIQAIRRARTKFSEETQYDQDKGLIEFYSSRAELLLKQYQNIEQLLGPPGSDWTCVGEHCESLLREAIQRILPPSLRVGKGYVYGMRKSEHGNERCPEIDILIYDADQFAPIFSMDPFVIVRADSVRAVIQVKRTLDTGTFKKAVQNVVSAKQHVLATCQFRSVITQSLFSAVVSFEEGVQPSNKPDLSESYRTVLKQHISDFDHGEVLPDYVGSLTGIFLHFRGPNIYSMHYNAFHSIQAGNNVALPFLLYMLTKKIRPFGCHILPAFPMSNPFGHFVVWEKPNTPPNESPKAADPAGTSDDETRPV